MSAQSVYPTCPQAAACHCPAPFVGPSLETTCGGGAFLVFMGLLDSILRRQCFLDDPCGRILPLVHRAVEYDFVVVGGGSAGAVMASRLSEVPGWNVLLLEAGGDEPPGAQVPSLVINYHGTDLDWQFHTEPEERACAGSPERRCSWIRGKVLGGSSTINGMVYMRGNPRDYDAWAKAGNTGWSFLEVLPYFKKSEDNLEVDELGYNYHGVGGPLTVTRFPYQPPMTNAILQAGIELGYHNNRDLNGASLTGIAVAQTTSRDGTRLSSAKAFLRPVLHRRNLHILLNATATKVLIDKISKRTYGLEFVHNGRNEKVRVRKEVVLSGGAIGSPHLLMLSGVGAPEDLARVGVPLVHALPGVGKNLNNHVAFPVTFSVRNSSDIFDLDWTAALEYIQNRRGPMSSTGLSQITAKFNTKYADPSGDDPDLQMFFAGSLANCAKTGAVGEIKDATSDANKAQVYFSPVVLHPKSRGYITLKSANPMDHPLIYANYFADPADVATLVEGLKLAVKLGETHTLRNEIGLELDRTPAAGCEKLEFASDAYWKCAVTHVSGPEVNHQAGSCRMGPVGDPGAVVDPQLHVQGIFGLRVVDASVIPANVSGNTNAPVIMIAEKAADYIKAQWQNSLLEVTTSGITTYGTAVSQIIPYGTEVNQVTSISWSPPGYTDLNGNNHQQFWWTQTHL